MNPKTRVAVRSLNDVVYVVPRLLGFTPKDSLVLVGLDGERQRMSFTMRVDLVDVAMPTMLAGLATRMRDSGASAALLYVYNDDETPTQRPLPYETLIADTSLSLLDAGVDIRDAVLVANGRFWSYVCNDETCCPAEGKPLEQNQATGLMDAAFAASGQGMSASREELVASVAKPKMPTAVDRLFQIATPARGPEMGTLLCSCITPDGPKISDEDAARFVLGMADIATRDGVIAMGLDDVLRDQMRGLLLSVCQRVSAYHDAPVCAVAALLAYVDGDGVLARALLDRADVSDPAYGLTALLRVALDNAIHPHEVKAAMSVRP